MPARYAARSSTCACHPAPCAAASSSGKPRSSMGRPPCRLRHAATPRESCRLPCAETSSNAPSLFLSSGDFGVQRVQPLFPQQSVATEPVVHLGQRLRPQAVHPPLSLLAHLDQPGLPEHPKVSSDSRPSDGQQGSQLTDSGL